VAPMTSSSAERILRSKIAARTLWARTIDTGQCVVTYQVGGYDATYIVPLDPDGSFNTQYDYNRDVRCKGHPRAFGTRQDGVLQEFQEWFVP
jgi:hypothetical protein